MSGYDLLVMALGGVPRDEHEAAIAWRDERIAGLEADCEAFRVELNLALASVEPSKKREADALAHAAELRTKLMAAEAERDHERRLANEWLAQVAGPVGQNSQSGRVVEEPGTSHADRVAALAADPRLYGPRARGAR